MLGNGLTHKIKWVLLVIIASLLLFRLNGFITIWSINTGLCNILNRVEEQQNIELFETDALGNSSRLIWIQGYRLWLDDKPVRAIMVWRDAPQYAAHMLINNVRVGDLASVEARESAIQAALKLDPKTSFISEIGSFYLVFDRRWETVINAFADVVEHEPGNGIAKAALALALYYVYGEETEPLVFTLVDEALALTPENVYTLRYSMRLMQMSSAFGHGRTEKLVTLAKAQLPQDFEFTFGVANAYRNIGELEMATKYNLTALKISPTHPWANLQQVELTQQLDENKSLEPWLTQTINNLVEERPDYYRRLLAILVEAGMLFKAKEIYCDGLEKGYSAEALLRLVANARISLESVDCDGKK